MTGELDYFDLITETQFPELTFAFFLVFMIIMTIIVVNLLIGLAVDDIQAVQHNAILKRLAMQVELVLDVERMLPIFILRRLTEQMVIFDIFWNILHQNFYIHISSRTLKK